MSQVCRLLGRPLPALPFSALGPVPFHPQRNCFPRSGGHTTPFSLGTCVLDRGKWPRQTAGGGAAERTYSLANAVELCFNLTLLAPQQIKHIGRSWHDYPRE